VVEKIRNFIERNSLLSSDSLYIVALSGGADSVALLRVLLLLGYHVEAAHCNFHLRGEESNRDEAFVADLCHRLDVSLHRAHFDTHTYAELHKVSIEMAARQLRYGYFSQLCHDLGARAVCVAHHRDDNVETMLMNLLRGTGIHGLVGIRPVSSVAGKGNKSAEMDKESEACPVVRPLLCVGRSEIEAWLGEQHQDYVTDSTNLIDDVERNKIRLDIIPLFKEINPSAIENMQRTCELMGEAELVYNSYTQEQLTRLVSHDTLDVRELRETASPLSILFEWLSPYGFSPATIRQIGDNLDAASGRIWSSATHDLCSDRGQLVLCLRQETPKPMRMPEPGLYVVPFDKRIRVSLETETSISTSPCCACLDADKVTFPLTVRTSNTGDRFIPFGMKGTKLVSDFLTDRKMALTAKRQQLVVTDAHDDILWIVGLRPAAPYCISPKTKRMLKLTLL
jgi:tRNA(Ile)-lysidine synthase